MTFQVRLSTLLHSRCDKINPYNKVLKITPISQLLNVFQCEFIRIQSQMKIRHNRPIQTSFPTQIVKLPTRIDRCCHTFQQNCPHHEAFHPHWLFRNYQCSFDDSAFTNNQPSKKCKMKTNLQRVAMQV